MPRVIEIDRRPVGEEQPAFIIAEIGINHNGDVEIAKKPIDAASLARCDAGKLLTDSLCAYAANLKKGSQGERKHSFLFQTLTGRAWPIAQQACAFGENPRRLQSQ